MNEIDLKRIKKMVAKKKKARKKKKAIVDVPQDKVFWVHDGPVLKNLEDLANELSKMSFETFHYHVNPYKNDFANWIKEVIGDAKLADEIRKLKTRKSTSRHVKEKIKQLNG
ncbi:MAG: hypothetical protein B6U97_00540 [Candidatus Altiarchaeales archaeon ex4484_96]|nr:MAG: hypothetical protein B6U97_00540 [Candidatus Altiarchaeales archaeon ex4484_96]